MDITNPNLNPSKMSEGERREFVHAILTDPRVNMKAMALAGSNGTTIDIGGLVQTIGLEKVENMLMKLFEDSDCGSILMNEKEIIDLMDKVDKGTATPEEVKMAKFIASTIARDGGTVPTSHGLATNLVTRMILDSMWFLKEKQNYQMTYGDMLTVIITLMIGSTSIEPGTAMNRYKDSGPKIVLPIIQHVTEDIEKVIQDAWGDKRPPADLYMLALMTLAEKVAFSLPGNQANWGNPQKIAEFFDLDYEVGFPGEEDKKENGPNAPAATNEKGNDKGSDTYTPNCYE